MSTNPREVVADQLSPEVLAIHQWIRDDAPVTIQMTITPTLISFLAARIQAARPILQPAVTEEAVEAARKAYVASSLSGSSAPMLDALTAALPYMMEDKANG